MNYLSTSGSKLVHIIVQVVKLKLTNRKNFRLLEVFVGRSL